MKERVLVTGGYGFIGSHVVKKLIDLGTYEIYILDNLANGKISNLAGINSKINFIKQDIRSNKIEKIFKARKFKTVYHLAALHYIPYCEQHPQETISVNIEGTQNILEASKNSGVKNLFIASTGAVYKSSNKPHVENNHTIAMDIYGISKITNESQVKLFSTKTNCRCSIGRIFNAVGAYETNPHLVPEILKRVKVSDKIEIGNTTPKRDYIHVKDIAVAIVTFTTMNKKPLDICNIGSGESYSVIEVVDILSRILNKKIKIIPMEKLKRKIDRPFLIANVSKIHKDYEWYPKYSFEKALEYALFPTNKKL